ncbi:DUF4193 domain-containing protein [Mycolicibacterium sp. XJ879]
MSTDYDAPRVKDTDDIADESVQEIAARRRQVDVAVLDVDDGDAVDSLDLPGADLSGEELTVRVVPKQADEFTCSSCFLVQHRSRIARETGGQTLCADCA